MQALLRAISAETLKMRRTLVLRLAVFAPLMIVLLQFGIYMVRGGEAGEGDANPSLGYLQIIFTLWTLVFLPFYASLVASLLADIEHRGQNWSFLLSLPIDRRCLYAAKWAAGALLLLFSTLVLWMSTVGTLLLVRLRQPDWNVFPLPVGTLTRYAFLSLVATALLFSIQMWISLRFRSFMVGLSVAITGILINLIVLPHRAMMVDSLDPWAIPVIVVAPHSPYRLLAIVWGISGGVLIMLAACHFMSRREYQ
jgi:ABC-2 type transport system permease protein